MQVCGDIMGPRSLSFQRPLVNCEVQLPISFGGINLLFMENCAPFAFIGSWVLVVPYLCSKFHILNRLVLEEYVFQVEGGPHLLQICLLEIQDNLPFIVREMHPSFEGLAIIGAPNFQAYLMDIHHDTSISLTFRACIRFCLGKKAGLWFITRPSIHSFCIAHSTFILVLHFRFGMIQPSASSLFMCECGHGMHLTYI